MSATKPGIDAHDLPTHDLPTHDLPGEILRVADEIRVRIHLAGMDAKDAWAKLEPRVNELQSKLVRASDRASAELDEVGRVLRHELDRLHKALFS